MLFIYLFEKRKVWDEQVFLSAIYWLFTRIRILYYKYNIENIIKQYSNNSEIIIIIIIIISRYYYLLSIILLELIGTPMGHESNGQLIS